jgi:hypothetical protein
LHTILRSLDLKRRQLHALVRPRHARHLTGVRSPSARRQSQGASLQTKRSGDPPKNSGRCGIDEKEAPAELPIPIGAARAEHRERGAANEQRGHTQPEPAHALGRERDNDDRGNDGTDYGVPMPGAPSGRILRA